MATAVYNEEIIALQDGAEVKLRPLAIGRLRRFMKAWEDFKEVDANDEDASLNIFVRCAGIAVEDSFKDKFDKTYQDSDLTEEYKTYLEDVLDMDTIYKILEVCGGLDLKNPKLREMAEAALATELDGKN